MTPHFAHCLAYYEFRLAKTATGSWQLGRTRFKNAVALYRKILGQ